MTWNQQLRVYTPSNNPPIPFRFSYFASIHIQIYKGIDVKRHPTKNHGLCEYTPGDRGVLGAFFMGKNPPFWSIEPCFGD